MEYHVTEVCFEPWALKVSNYWSFVGKCKPCYVLLGECKDVEILMIEKSNEYGLLFNEPAKFPSVRNLIWHEVGHSKNKKASNSVQDEFLADKWAIEEALSRGYNKIVEEILFRCFHFYCTDDSYTYTESAKQIICTFNDIVYKRNILERYKKRAFKE